MQSAGAANPYRCDGWAHGVMVRWSPSGDARESTDGGKTWREFTVDMTRCGSCGNPVMKRIYKDSPSDQA